MTTPEIKEGEKKWSWVFLDILVVTLLLSVVVVVDNIWWLRAGFAGFVFGILFSSLLDSKDHKNGICPYITK